MDRAGCVILHYAIRRRGLRSTRWRASESLTLGYRGLVGDGVDHRPQASLDRLKAPVLGVKRHLRRVRATASEAGRFDETLEVAADPDEGSGVHSLGPVARPPAVVVVKVVLLVTDAGLDEHKVSRGGDDGGDLFAVY